MTFWTSSFAPLPPCKISTKPGTKNSIEGVTVIFSGFVYIVFVMMVLFMLVVLTDQVIILTKSLYGIDLYYF